jgi:hypothetical protein
MALAIAGGQASIRLLFGQERRPFAEPVFHGFGVNLDCLI